MLLKKMLFRYFVNLRVAQVIVFAALALYPGVSGAEEAAWQPSPAGKPSLEEARAAFAEGRALMEEEKWLEAVRKFEYAAAAKNTPGLRYYIGYCWERQGATEEAFVHYQTAQELLAHVPAVDVEQIIPEALARVKGKLALVELTGAPQGVALHVDGKPRAATNELYLGPGRHTLLLEKEGHVDFSVTLLLEPGERSEVRVQMPPLSTDPTPALQARDAESTGGWRAPRKVVFWTSLGASAVGLGTGIVGTVQRSAAQRRFRDFRAEADKLSGGSSAACANPSGDLIRVCNNLDLASERRTTSTVAMVGGYALFGVGVAGALTAAFLWPEAPVKVEMGASSRDVWLGVRSVF